MSTTDTCCRRLLICDLFVSVVRLAVFLTFPAIVSHAFAGPPTSEPNAKGHASNTEQATANASDAELVPISNVKVWATVYDPDTLSTWNATGFVPAFLDGVEVEDVALSETVFELNVVAPDATGQWFHLKGRVRGSDGAIAVVSMLPIVVPADPIAAPGVVGAPTRGCDGGPWWRRGRICCFTQYLICSTVHRLLPAHCSHCDDCFWDCFYCNVDNPCHSCGDCGGSQILCFWFGYC